mgnify:CR=1 FL=1
MPMAFNPEPPGTVDWLAGRAQSNAKGVARVEGDRGYSPWITPTLLNGYADPDAPMRTVQYRWDFKADKPDFRGHIDASAATSDTIAFYISTAYSIEYDISFVTDIKIGTSIYQSARVFINSTDNSITIVWPTT